MSVELPRWFFVLVERVAAESKKWSSDRWQVANEAINLLDEFSDGDSYCSVDDPVSDLLGLVVEEVEKLRAVVATPEIYAGVVTEVLERERELLARDNCQLRKGVERSEREHTVLLEANTRLLAENDQLVTDRAHITNALHEAIRRPMGVVPDSAECWVTHELMDWAESRRIALPLPLLREDS